MNTTSSKPHYPIFDGLLVVAAFMDSCFPHFEAHATSHLDQITNHGYLAVDFSFTIWFCCWIRLIIDEIKC
jgi:hypothetical protein